MIVWYAEFAAVCICYQAVIQHGTKRLCKVLLRSHQIDAIDADMVHEFKRILIDAR